MESTSGSKEDDISSEADAKSFDRLLRDALASLYDLPHLQSHPFAALQPEAPDAPPAELGRLLQNRLLEGIEHLRPVHNDGVTAERALRRHKIMELRYVDGLQEAELLDQIGFSRAVYYSQLSVGINAIAEHLRTVFTEGAAPEPHLMPIWHESPL